MSFRDYITRVAVGFDQFGNTLIGGDDDETLSARIMRWDEQGRVAGKIGHWVLDHLQANHCENAVLNDEKRGEYIDARMEATKKQEKR